MRRIIINYKRLNETLENVYKAGGFFKDLEKRKTEMLNYFKSLEGGKLFYVLENIKKIDAENILINKPSEMLISEFNILEEMKDKYPKTYKYYKQELESRENFSSQKLENLALKMGFKEVIG